MIKVLKVAVFLLCLVPFVLLVSGFLTAKLGANPVEALTHTTGDWILRFLVITLSMTPLRRLTGWKAATRFRRMFGLFAFFYSCLHFTIYCISISNLDFAEIVSSLSARNSPSRSTWWPRSSQTDQVLCGPGHQTRASREAGSSHLCQEVALRATPGSDDPGHK